MVGIPGRSKGCKTCRRRKIGCDLQEPQCGQCKKSGRHCEGFDKDIAFIHRTPQGLLRKGQEQCQGPAPWETSCGANSTSTKQIPPQINNAAIYVDGMLHTFLVAFLPSSPILPLSHHSNITVPPAPWMRIAIALPRRGPLLSTALQALCMTKIARAHGDQALLMQGMAAHTQALRALQNAINDRNTALTDETLAAIRVLGTYELHEGTMGSVVGWTSHEEGVDQLVQLRGFNSSQYESELGQALFGEVRRSAMIRGLQFFKGSFFSETRWCIEPWGTKPKDYVQQLYDIGLLLPPILEELHTIQSLPNAPRRAQIWQRCQHLEDRFSAWHARLLTLFPTPPYWEEPAELMDRSSDIRPGPFEASFDFLNIHVADSLDFFWALRILLHTVLRRLSGAPEQSDAIIGACACNIARSVPYFTQPKCGFLGVQWLIFPLKTAFSAFRQMGWEIEWEWSRGVLVAMKNRGISYGGDIVDAQWGERVR
ncbi:hypothetical protein COH20_002821 [Aspergillus flavus]|uniref:DNA, SC102 n=1 Tax=Aspergillus oryzae (strain ATCC 42149 / RIB 40) TaxID=510516 RepID=Q2UBE2_ASPOR|nr:unnamed protein product [Aspergillus oryzae RIB40]RAQ63113.1 hypothetical protein COH21_010377 [Aspergillus flavus]RAQ66119.1 hypothetical protein COH20_002821 [Aspergillus flavus]BAE61123.1 unnamed protein product [Aspergillus oryzae RIB40]